MAGLTASLLGASAGLGAVGTVASLISGKAQASYQRAVSRVNEQFAEMQAQDSLRRGELEARQVGIRGNLIEGEQVASLAGQNVDVDEGTAAELRAETRVGKKEDIITVRNNAFREALGYKMQAFGIASQARLNTAAARAQQTSTILTGGSQFARGLAQYSAYQESRT
jgi:hypothetical protein